MVLLWISKTFLFRALSLTLRERQSRPAQSHDPTDTLRYQASRDIIARGKGLRGDRVPG